jgi:hypothetical protein
VNDREGVGVDALALVENALTVLLWQSAPNRGRVAHRDARLALSYAPLTTSASTSLGRSLQGASHYRTDPMSAPASMRGRALFVGSQRPCIVAVLQKHLHADTVGRPGRRRSRTRCDQRKFCADRQGAQDAASARIHRVLLCLRPSIRRGR